MGVIYHSNTVKNKGREYIFYKELRHEKDGTISKIMDYTTSNRFEYFYYKTDKDKILDNDFEHYFVPKSCPTMEKREKSDAYKNWDFVDKSKIYNFNSAEKNFRLAKIKDLAPKTFVYRNTSVLYLDIEVFQEQEVDMFDPKVSIFARYVNPINAISMTLQDNKTGELKSFVYVYDWIEREKYYSPDYEVTYFTSEKDLLKAFVKFVNSSNPDIYCGWNVNFDLTYLYCRLSAVLGNLYANALSPYFSMFVGNDNPKLNFDASDMKLANLYEKLEKIEMNGAFVGEEYKTKISIAGINVIDYLETMKKKDAVKSEVKENYSLDFVAEEELGMNKVSYRDAYGSIDNMFKNNLELFIRYNMEDTNLVFKLEEKLGYIKTLIIINAICQIQNIEDSQGTVRLWEDVISVYNDKILNNYEIHIDKKNRTKGGRYPGALDMNVDMLNNEVKYGLMTYDWASLYPTTIVSLNCSPEKKKVIRKGKYQDIKELIYTVYEHGETLENLKDVPKLTESIQASIDNILSQVESGKYRKKDWSEEVAVFEKKKKQFEGKTYDVQKYIDAYEADKEQLLGIDEVDKILNLCYNDIPNYSWGITQFYKKNSMGVLPYIMNDVFNTRIMYKKLAQAMEDFLKGGISDADFKALAEKLKANESDEYKEFEHAMKKHDKKTCEIVKDFCKFLEGSLKIFLNSGYGAIGNNYFKFYDRDMASAVTLSSRRILNELIKNVNSWMEEEFNSKKKRIVYGATDSIFVSFEELFTKEELVSMRNEDMMERVFAFLKKIGMDAKIKSFYTHIEKNIFSSFTNIWALEMEKFSREAVFFGQKNYILKLIYKGNSYTKGKEFDYKYVMKGVKLKKVDTPSFLRTEEKQKDLLEMIFKSRKVNPELLHIEEWLYSIYDEYVSLGAKDPYILGGSVNVGSKKMKEYLNPSMTSVIKNHCPGQYSGIAVYNNFIKRAIPEKAEEFLMKNEGINEKVVPVYMQYDGDFIVEHIEYERKTKTKKKVATMALPMKIKMNDALVKIFCEHVDFYSIFEKKVMSNLLGYVKVSEDVDYYKLVKQHSNMMKEGVLL